MQYREFPRTFSSNYRYKLTRENQTSNILQKAGMAGNVVTNFIKNHIAVLVSCNDNLCKAMTQLLIDYRRKYLRYPLMEAEIFILSCNVEINKYRLQQVDIGILFRLCILVHLVISSSLWHVEPLWTNERHLHLRLNLFFYEWNVNKLSDSPYNSTFQHYEAFRYFGLREMIFSWKICKVMMKTRVYTHKFDMYFILNH